VWRRSSAQAASLVPTRPSQPLPRLPQTAPQYAARVSAVEAINASWAAAISDQRGLAGGVTQLCRHAAGLPGWHRLSPAMLTQVGGEEWRAARLRKLAARSILSRLIVNTPVGMPAAGQWGCAGTAACAERTWLAPGPNPARSALSLFGLPRALRPCCPKSVTTTNTSRAPSPSLQCQSTRPPVLPTL
jgi:hypothetical protein